VKTDRTHYFIGIRKIMGVEDRDWYRDAQREREKQRQIDETRGKFAGFSRQHLGAKAVSPTKTGLIPMMLFWFVVMGLLYLGMAHYLKPRQVHVLANGDLVINRSHDGHFYTTGTINGREAIFMVDTGASLVSVSEKFAQKASIRGGVPTTFKTANGDRSGRVVNDVAVTLGPVTLSNVRVGVGISGGDENDALLGQSFLSKFDININKNQMVLRAR
jgi:aspartyl protease family protein